MTSNDKILMIPGPIEFEPQVLEAMATKATSHVDPGFIRKFSETIKMLRTVFKTSSGQPLVLAGSGTLTWDITASNLIESGDHVLVYNTGKFGDWFGECIQVYGGLVTFLKAPFGDFPSLTDLEDELRSKSYKMITITQVDTSTGVLAPVKEICSLVKKLSPNTLIALDGVCSIACEEMLMDEWGIDVAMTGSQKGLGVPPGLAVMVVSQRALALERKSAPSSYFCQFQKWLPIMKAYESCTPSYFATPPVQSILALHASLLLMTDIDARITQHRISSDKFKQRITALGLKIVPKSIEKAAHSLTAIYYPENVDPKTFLSKITEQGVIVAGGLHPEYASKYFRVGHMGLSVMRDVGHLERTLNAIEKAL